MFRLNTGWYHMSSGLFGSDRTCQWEINTLQPFGDSLVFQRPPVTNVRWPSRVLWRLLVSDSPGKQTYCKRVCIYNSSLADADTQLPLNCSAHVAFFVTAMFLCCPHSYSLGTRRTLRSTAINPYKCIFAILSLQNVTCASSFYEITSKEIICIPQLTYGGVCWRSWDWDLFPFSERQYFSGMWRM